MPTRAKTFSERQGRTRTDRAYERRRQADTGLAKAQSILGSARWQRFRRFFLRRNPVCADPLGHHAADGVTVPAQQVHHKEKLRNRPDLALVSENCMAVCTVCHAKVEG